MLDRRTFLLGAGAALVSSEQALAQRKKKYRISSKHEPKRVAFKGYPPGTIVVKPRQRHLYLVESGGKATRYIVGVGRAGLSFRGSAVIARKAEWPGWRPTDSMIRRNPWKYARYRNGVPGGPKSPLGSRALYLYQNGRDTYYRIHGTTKPRSIGRAASAGCIRMHNAHIEQLYTRVPVGTRVVVL